MARNASLWLIGLLLAISLAAFLSALTAMQLTSEDTGTRVLRRSVAVTTGIDTILPQIQQAVRDEAANSTAGTIQVPGFPVPVVLTREEAATLEGAALRDVILERAGDELYDEGMSAWTAGDPGATRDLDRLSAAGALDNGLGLISDSHTVFLVLTVFFGVLTLVIAAGLFLAVPADGRLVAFGGVGLLASLPLLAAAVALRFAFRTTGTDGDPFIDGLLDIGADAMWVPIRNFFTVTMLSVVVLLIGSLALWWESKNVRTAP